MDMPASSEKEIIELDSGVYARLWHNMTNAGFIVGDKGVLVIDSLGVPSFARDLMQDIRYVTNKPIQYVVDTHSHWDHSWGNEEFAEATIIGHQNCYAEMVDIEWNDNWRRKVVTGNHPWSQEASIVNITPPNLTFETSMQLYFGGKEINLHYFGRAHTSDDIFIHLPKERIVFTGDVAEDRSVPYFGDSYPEDWPETASRLLSLPVERFVSGHGPIGSYETLVEAQNFIRQLVENLRNAKQEVQDEVAASNITRAALNPQFGDWRGFDRIDEAILEVYRKLN
jgi:glyoxylase-like metal-dependent hydrolase (beta-lactamase superfamily II)